MKLPFTQWISGFSKNILSVGLFIFCFFLLENAVAQNCPPPNQGLVIINQVTDSTAVLNWPNVMQADQYIVEYGPAGYSAGAGIMDTLVVSGVTLDSLNPCVEYAVFLYSICGNNVSAPVGPFFFTTTSPEMCTYTFNLSDTFGDGWNGAVLTVDHNGKQFLYTVPNPGFNATFELEAFSSAPICISYSPGTFENEVSFNITDPGGTVIYSDGPFPETGNIMNIIACGATCSAPKMWNMEDVNATNATTAWSFLPGFGGDVLLEYGPLGFMRGTGTQVNVPSGQSSFKMTGLEEKTWYNVYLGVDCGVDSSKVIGPLVFETLWLVDVGVTAILPNADEFCNLGSNEIVTVGLTNFGQAPQTLFDFFFAVNGVAANIPMPQDGFFTGVVGNDSTQLIQFETTWDFSLPGLYVIEAWTVLEDDSDISNDTFRVEFLNSFPKPIEENFEDLAIPDDWTMDGTSDFYGPLAHNNPTAVIASNLYVSVPTFELTTGRIGPVLSGDTLSFDYRFVDWSLGTDSTLLSGGDSLIVQISSDCEETYETVLVIDSVNHVPTTDMTNQIILLDDYDGLTIYVRFLAKWGAGDYWFDLDNINVKGTCPASFGALVDIDGAFENDTNGVATITPIAGTGPYIFEWSTNESDTSDIGVLDGIGSGAYFVSITDVNGCMETLTFEVGTLVAADEVYGVEEISVYPNPTSGRVSLDISLTSAMDVQARIMDMGGRMVFETERSTAYSIQEQLDLSDQPVGLYILQVIADGKPYYAKLMVAR